MILGVVMMASFNEERSTVTTGDCFEKRTITWKIQDFEYIRRSEQLIRSQVVRINLGDRLGIPTTLSCFLLPKVDDPKDVKQVGIHLKLDKAPTGSTEVIASFKATITKLNSSFGPCVKNFLEGGKPQRWGWANFIAPETAANSFLTEGCLTLELEVRLYSSQLEAKLLTITADNMYSAYIPKFAQKLHDDFAKMITDPPKGSDVVTKMTSKDGVEFIVSRGILAARSPVFEKMFQADMEETKTGVINIADLSSDVITVLLNFLYTGTLQKDWTATDLLPQLVHAAGKYQLPDLLGFLDEVAGVVCCKENAGRLVGLARRMGLKQAEKDVMTFMKKHLDTLDDILEFAEECAVPNF